MITKEEARALKPGDRVLVELEVGKDISMVTTGEMALRLYRTIPAQDVTILGKPGGKKITVSASEIVGVVEVQIPDLEGGRHSFPRPCHPSRVEEVAQKVRVSLHAIAPGCVEMPGVMLNGRPEKFPGDRSGDSLVEVFQWDECGSFDNMRDNVEELHLMLMGVEKKFEERVAELEAALSGNPIGDNKYRLALIANGTTAAVAREGKK